MYINVKQGCLPTDVSHRVRTKKQEMEGRVSNEYSDDRYNWRRHTHGAFKLKTLCTLSSKFGVPPLLSSGAVTFQRI